MPMVDMPLEELKNYRGINPCPDDMDAYWDRAVAQMHALGTGCTLRPAAFQAPGAECFDLYFTGVGGARVHAKLLKPSHLTGRAPAVLQFHGYSGNCGSFASKLNYVCAGFVVAAMDVRGQAGSSEELGGVRGTTYHGHIIRGLDDPDPDKLLFRNIFLDTAQLARIVRALEYVDAGRIGAMGGSQGGALTLACAALEPSIRRITPRIPFLCDYQRVWEMDLAKDAYAELSYYFRNFDPLHRREREIFTKLGYIDNQHLAHRIRAEVQMSTGLMDTICPPSTQFAVYNRITSPKHMLVYPDFGHEDMPDGDELDMQFLLGL